MQRSLTWRVGLRPRIFWPLLAVLANALDLASTVWGLHLGIPEDNPLMQSVLDLRGELAMYALKVVIIASLIFLIERVQHRFRLAWVFYLGMILPPLLVLVNNIALIVRAIA